VTANLARNVATRYLAIVVDALIGLLVLPYTISHLGKSAYGLWMLTASVTTYFTVLQLGYGGAIVKFVAEFRARRNPQALNEVISTMFFVYTGIGVAAYLLALVVAFYLPGLFNFEPGQAPIGQKVLLISAAQIALYFPFSVYGGVINGFERFYINNVVGTISNIAAATAQVLVLHWGYGLVEVVMATTTLRTVPFLVYRFNAYRAFPAMRIRPTFFRRDRLRHLTGFSAYLAVIDWASRLNYATDLVVIGMFLTTGAAGIYSVGQRLTDAMFKVTSQLHTLLFPAVVHRAATGEAEGQRSLMIKATRFQLAIAMAVCMTAAVDGPVLIRAYFGRGFESSVVILQLLSGVVVLRAWMAMPSTVLKGTGHERYVAITSSVCAVANLLLSVVLVKWMGTTGVALGTVVPCTVLAASAIFPKACRTVELPLARGYREIVWRAVWPAVLPAVLLMLTRSAVPVRLLFVAAHMALGALLYAALFVAFAMERQERRWIMTTLMTMTQRRRSEGLAAA
jgi:O-antigen/teichoic acid export membrane protein